MQQTARRRRVVWLGVGWLGVLMLAFPADTAHAGHWMYRRSYFNNGLPAGERRLTMPPLRSRSAYRPAVVGTRFGFAARGGYRYNRIFLRSGQSTDLTVIREDWFDVRP